MKDIILNSMCEACSMKPSNGLAGAPSSDSAQPAMTAITSTCSTSPLANAPRNVVGISLSKNSSMPELLTLAAVST